MDYNTLFPEKQSQHAASRFTALAREQKLRL